MKTNPIQKLIVLVTLLLGINYSNAQQTIWEGCATATYSVTNTTGSTYAWSVTPSSGTITGNTTNTIGIDWTGVATGNYTVSVIETNSSGCPGLPQNVTVNIITTPTAAATITQPTCAVATATIEVTSPIGTGFEYSIDNGATWQSTTTFSNITANTNHTVIVKNQTGCLSIATGVVVNPQPATPTTSTITFN
jgi:hypothetical protein